MVVPSIRSEPKKRYSVVRTALLLASIVASVLTIACGGGEHCPQPGAACGTKPQYDLVLTEADSGKAGVSMGGGVAFLLDGRRDRLVTSPALGVKTIDDPYNQFPGKHAFALPTYQDGVFDVVATGTGIAPFTFHVVIGRLMPVGSTQVTLLHRGDLVVEQYQSSLGPNDQPSALRGPAFDLVQDAVTVGAEGRILGNQPAMTRRAYRAAQFGAQLVTTGTTGYPYRVVVADTPPSFRDFVDGGAQVPDAVLIDAGHRFAVVFTGDGQQISWTAQPADAVVRLPDADIGPQPPGATLVPFRVMVEGKVSLQIRTTSRTITVSIQSGLPTCLPDDFPRYLLAQTTGISNIGSCRVDMASTDSLTQVLAFYRLRLTDGDWRVVSVGGSTIMFSRRSNPTIGGTLKVDSGGIHVRMNSETPIP